MPHFPGRTGAAALALTALLGAGCAAGGEDPDGGPVPETIDRYIATVYDTDSEITYLAELDALTGTADFTGTQVVGSTIAVGFGDDPYVYIGSSASSTIGRYEFTVDGMVLDEEIDLLNEGTTATSGYQSHLILVDRTKAYYIDVPNNQLVIWNPTEMTITGSEDFSAPIAMADMRSGIGGFPVQVGTKLFYGVGWLDATTLEVVGGAAVLVIDTTDDTAELVRELGVGEIFSAQSPADLAVEMGRPLAQLLHLTQYGYSSPGFGPPQHIQHG